MAARLFCGVWGARRPLVHPELRLGAHRAPMQGPAACTEPLQAQVHGWGPPQAWGRVPQKHPTMVDCEGAPAGVLEAPALPGPGPAMDTQPGGHSHMAWAPRTHFQKDPVAAVRMAVTFPKGAAVVSSKTFLQSQKETGRGTRGTRPCCAPRDLPRGRGGPAPPPLRHLPDLQLGPQGSQRRPALCTRLGVPEQG